MAEVVQADIVAGRVAGDVVEHVLLGDTMHRPADDHGDLTLVVQEAAARGRRSTPPWPLSVVGGFMK